MFYLLETTDARESLPKWEAPQIKSKEMAHPQATKSHHQATSFTTHFTTI
jgi:hypothetical protein